MLNFNATNSMQLDRASTTLSNELVTDLLETIYVKIDKVTSQYAA